MRNISSPLDGFSSPFGARRGSGSISPFALYAANGFTPPLVADYKNEVYAVDGVASTFDDMHTYAGASLKTMVDSDGVLKWAPHNLLSYSQQFDNDAWTAIFIGAGALPVLTANHGTAPDGTLTAYRLQASRSNAGGGDRSHLQLLVTAPLGSSLTRSIWVKSTDGTPQDIQTTDSTENFSTSTVTVGAEWQLIEFDYDNTLSESSRFQVGFTNTDTASLTSDVLIWGAHIYRSDLGGMVNNPDTGDSYVPTTTAARYLPRRGNHVWDGAEWVNEGVLIESAAATNFLLNSGTLATQSVTVTAVPHTLHFTGTGTVTLTGASTAGPLVGTGTGEENRTSLTFTPTAGSLTLTVSGTVSVAQLEVGSVPTSHIPTAGATATRAAETLQIDAANMPAYTDAVSLAMKGTMTYADTGASFEVRPIYWYANSTNQINWQLSTIGTRTGQIVFAQNLAGAFSIVNGGQTDYAPGVNVPISAASRHGSSSINGAGEGVSFTEDTSPTGIADLSATPFKIAQFGIMNIGRVLAWPEYIGDTGIDEASA